MSRTIFQRIIDREIPATIEHEDNPAAWAKPIQLCRTLHETRLTNSKPPRPAARFFGMIVKPDVAAAEILAATPPFMLRSEITMVLKMGNSLQSPP